MLKTLGCSFCLWLLATVAVAGAEPAVALIIDDLGYQWRGDKRAINLPGPVAISILPETPYAKRLAEYAKKRNVTVMLHLPLASLKGGALESGVSLDTTEAEFRLYLESSLQAIPHVQGINNHQGSLLTQHPGHMSWLMQDMMARGNLFFIDSYTTHHSVALGIAKEYGIPAMRRHVFLDDKNDLESIEQQFRRLKRMARRQGVALAIAHPRKMTLEFLEKNLPKLSEDGISLVDVTQAIALSQNKPTQ